jgi:hypothetical protein
LAKLGPHPKFVIEASLRSLLAELQKCTSPSRDPVFQSWAPSRWDVPRHLATLGEWVEYRLGDKENRARAIICFDESENSIYLVARTAIHDHASLRELVGRFAPKRILKIGKAPPSA